jgi:hypothetical protein
MDLRLGSAQPYCLIDHASGYWMTSTIFTLNLTYWVDAYVSWPASFDISELQSLQPSLLISKDVLIDKD